MRGAPPPSKLSSLSPCIGRDEDLQRLFTFVERGARLITLHGAAGVGKTRLAREMLARSFPATTRRLFCDLSEVVDRDGLRQAIGAALEVPIARATSTIDPLLLAIAERGELVLVLDNGAAAVDALSEFVSSLCRAADRARVIVTTREVLRVQGEHAYEVKPLELEHAIALFVECARHVRPTYALDDGNAPLVAEIVRRLDGLPLAIELTAPRLRVMDERAIAARLDQALDLAAVGARDATSRHRTLRAAIESSFRVLAPEERAALAQTTVFRGGFDLEAAEAVLSIRAPDAPDASDASILDVLQSLREKSLLCIDASDREHGLRFRHLESIRAFGWEELVASTKDRETIERHAAHYLALAETLGNDVGRDRDAERRLLRELDNVVAVHARATDGDVSLRAALSLEAFFLARGPYGRSLALLDSALEKAGDGAPRYARGLLARGRAREAAGGDGLASLQAALELARRSGDAFVESNALAAIAAHRTTRGDLEGSRRELLAALPLFDRERDPEGLSRCEGQLGLVLRYLGDVDGARDHLKSAIAVAERSGLVRRQAYALGILAGLLHGEGDLDGAREGFERALSLLGRIDDDGRFYAYFSGNFGVLLQEIGRADEARERYEEALRLARSIGDLRAIGGFHGYLGTLAHERGELAVAQEHYALSIDRLESVGDRRMANVFRACAGALDAMNGARAEAAQKLDLAEETLRALGASANTLVELHRGHLDLAEASALERSGDHPAANALRARARARLTCSTDASTVPNDDVRWARRLLHRALSRLPGQERTLVIASEGAWFRVRDGAVVDLRRQGNARQILAILARRRRDAPGTISSIDEIVAAVWPNERMLPRAALNRVRVAMATLRKLGLREWIAHRDDGYLLDPTERIEIVEGEPSD